MPRAITSSRAPSPRSTFGNAASATQTITVEDTTPPEFSSVPANVPNGECGDALPTAMASAEDNQTSASDRQCGHHCWGWICQYVVVRTFVATDDAGNSANATQTITIADTSTPEFTFSFRHRWDCAEDIPMDMPTAVDNARS